MLFVPTRSISVAAPVPLSLVASMNRLRRNNEGRRAAATAWKALGARKRKEVLELGRRGSLHPDPAVRETARAWSEWHAFNLRWTIVATLVMAALAVFWTRVLGGSWLLTLLIVGCFTFGILVNAFLLFGRLKRLSDDPAAPVATDAETQSIGAIPGVRLGWFMRATAIVVGLLLGLPFILVGVVVVVEGNGSRVVGGVVGVVGAGLFVFGLRAIRLQRQVGRQREG